MGMTKDLYFQQLEQADIAEELAVETGFLNRCEYHPTFVWQNDWDLDRLYRIAAWRFNLILPRRTRPSAIPEFQTSRKIQFDMARTDAVKAIRCPQIPR